MIQYALPSFSLFFINVVIIILIIRIVKWNELSIFIVSLIAIFGTINLMNGLVLVAPSEDMALAFASILALLAFGGAGFVLYFVLIFPQRQYSMNPHIMMTLCFLPTILFDLLFFTGLYLKGIEKTEFGYRESFGPLFQLFSVYLVLLTLGVVAYLVIRYKKAKGIEKKQILPIIVGIVMILLMSQIMYVFAGGEVASKMVYPPVGVWMGTVWGVVIYYSIKKYSLLRFTPGRTYIVWDKEHGELLNKLEPLMDVGYRCVLLTNHNPRFIKKEHKQLEIIWMSNIKNTSDIRPAFPEEVKEHFDKTIKAESGNSIYIFDGFDYLATSEGIGFDTTLRLLRKMVNANANSSNLLFVPISSTSFSKNQNSHILKSGVDVLNKY